jgi:hypothetical protein
MSTAKAQQIRTKTYEFNLGFSVGRPAYWGDYNAGLMGSGYPYSNGVTPQQTFGSDISYGVHAWIPLKWGFSLRPGLEYGNLNYSIPDPIDPYQMQTPYHLFSVHLQYDLDFDAAFTPYFSFGYDALNFKTPMQNEIPDFILDSSILPYQTGKASSYPITLGFNYELGELSSLFVESTLRFTSTDLLDNFTPTESNFSFKNDAIFSYQAGLRVKVINVIRLLFDNPKSQPLRVFTHEPVQVTWKPSLPQMQPIPQRVAAPILSEPIAEVEPEQESEPVNTEPVIPTVVAPIPVVEPENRVFDREAELKKIEELQQQKETQPDELVEEKKSNLDWDPRIPVIQTKASAIPEEILDNGFVTDVAPEGYYVQVFATVGPITSTRVRKQIIEEAQKQNLLADPERQVVIMKRKKFYEVRIGVFDSYEQTLRVLEAMQGIYFDSYSLIYLPDNR